MSERHGGATATTVAKKGTRDYILPQETGFKVKPLLPQKVTFVGVALKTTDEQRIQNKQL
jgi:hypothetical protein